MLELSAALDKADKYDELYNACFVMLDNIKRYWLRTGKEKEWSVSAEDVRKIAKLIDFE
jgi:hypothetical protein